MTYLRRNSAKAVVQTSLLTSAKKKKKKPLEETELAPESPLKLKKKKESYVLASLLVKDISERALSDVLTSVVDKCMCFPSAESKMMNPSNP